jgi:hypothetical protein
MHRIRIGSAAGVAALVAAGALAGCGGGGGGSSFEAKADSVCKDTTAKLNGLKRPTTAAGLPGYLDRASAIARTARGKLATVKPPSGKKGPYAAYLAALERQGAVFDRARAVAHTGNARQAVAMLQAATGSGRAVKARAKGLGLTECSK